LRYGELSTMRHVCCNKWQWWVSNNKHNNIHYPLLPLLLLLTHRLVSFKLLHGLLSICAISAFVPPSVIPNLQKNSWCGKAINQICGWMLIDGQHRQTYSFPTATLLLP
jgi:hypothetical protein